MMTSENIDFELDVDVTHSVPPELLDTLEFSDDAEVEVKDD